MTQIEPGLPGSILSNNGNREVKCNPSSKIWSWNSEMRICFIFNVPKTDASVIKAEIGGFNVERVFVYTYSCLHRLFPKN